MLPFAQAHATHPDWRAALGLVVAQLEAQLAERPAPTLGWCYLSDHHGPAAPALLAALRERYPDVDWVGAVGIGVSASGVEYFDEPGLSIMLATLPRADYRLFSGRRPLPPSGWRAHTALVHADPATPDLAELIAELSTRTDSGYLFGGLASARSATLTLAAEHGADGADGVFRGGLSGVAFGPGIGLLSRVTQGCQPVGAARRITESERNIVYALDGEPALDCLLHDLGIDGQEPREALPRLRGTLVGLSPPEEGAAAGLPTQHLAFATPARRGAFGTETRVRHLVGIDPQRRGIAIADHAPEGEQLAFCRRDTEAARRDLVRVATELRSALEPEDPPAPGAPAAPTRMLGALYFSCTGRGGPHFGAPSAELQLLRHALGDVPLTGFFAAGEIGHHQLYGYTGVLTVFTAPVYPR